MSFIIRGLAHYFAASVMESRESSASSANYDNYVFSYPLKKEWRRITGMPAWKKLPAVLKASKCVMRITNRKTGATIVIDGSSPMPDITAEWLAEGEGE